MWSDSSLVATSFRPPEQNWFSATLSNISSQSLSYFCMSQDQEKCTMPRRERTQKLTLFLSGCLVIEVFFHNQNVSSCCCWATFSTSHTNDHRPFVCIICILSFVRWMFIFISQLLCLVLFLVLLLLLFMYYLLSLKDSFCRCAIYFFLQTFGRKLLYTFNRIWWLWYTIILFVKISFFWVWLNLFVPVILYCYFTTICFYADIIIIFFRLGS